MYTDDLSIFKKDDSFPAYDITKKIGGSCGIPPQNSGFGGGGIEPSIFINFWANVLKKKSRNLEQKLSSKKFFYGHRIFYGFRIYFWKKRFASFLLISQKALNDACKVPSKGTYPHPKYPENFFSRLDISEFSSECND